MPLPDVDLLRRRESVGISPDLVDFVLYSYNESFFEEQIFHSAHSLLAQLENETDDEETIDSRFYWIEVINRSSAALPESIKQLCDHFDIHPLTIEDISTLAPYTKLDLFYEEEALFLVMKAVTWTERRVHQQQISFYLKCSQNLLITFQEDSREHPETFFRTIRHRLRRDQSNHVDHLQSSRLRKLNVDYLFYSLVDDVIDRYILLMEEISSRISQFDEELMLNSRARTAETLYAIYLLRHDLLHLKILFNPLREIIDRLRRATSDEYSVALLRPDPSLRVGIKHHVLRRQIKGMRLIQVSHQSMPHSPSITRVNPRRHQNHRKPTLKSNFLNEYIFVYLNDLNNHVDQLLDSLDIQRESVAFLISFWIALNGDETQNILKFLMLISVLFMPCLLLTGINSTNFQVQPQYEYFYGYYIVLSLLGFLLTSMVSWYKYKKWI